MSVKHATFLCILLSLTSSVFAGEQDDELNWLKTITFAVHQAEYSGIFVYQNGSRVETSRITHVVDRDGEHGRLEAMDGARREIIRSNGEVWCYLGDRKMRLEERRAGGSFPALLPEQMALLNENYQIRRVEDDRVAGFPTHAMEFQPRDSLRYTHKMWAHSDSGLLLKAQVLDDRGRAIEQYAFIQLSIGGNVDRSWLAVESSPGQPMIKSNAGYAPHAELPEYSSGWQVDMLPAGFKKVAEIQRPMHGRNGQVTQIVFSDGLAGISVFIEKAEDDESRVRLSGQGLIQIYSRQVDDHLVTVVGEVPPRTVIQVGDSVRFAGNP